MTRNHLRDKQAIDRIPIDVYSDPIFFHKSQTRVGTILRFVGRTAPNSTWIIQRIYTLRHTQHGWVKSWVTETRKLDDILELRCEQTGEIKRIRFGYASYSAIWRIQ